MWTGVKARASASRGCRRDRSRYFRVFMPSIHENRAARSGFKAAPRTQPPLATPGRLVVPGGPIEIRHRLRLTSLEWIEEKFRDSQPPT
jgi:hypothetical protein